ncbi:MAG: electron transfer flavoprotein subunit alpha/FixB family protein [Pseudobdellovibrionaceae bacterium]|nr:electron transfer flavoprotein subunit alpha/FixB family protein [Bdellovibrionales bacterium]USN46834.1 MAG: electron transfer flavoprotein subunit alpha/FixB family protein [Pseudobdellovibrionaceae bacterium]
MANVLVFCEVANGQLKKGSLELLSAAKNCGGQISAAAIGLAANQVTAEMGKYGASAAFVCTDEKLSQYNPEAYSQVLSKIFEQSGADMMFASSTAMARDLFPRVAEKVAAGIASDCTELSFTNGQVKVRRPLYAGKCSAEVKFQNCDKQIILMRPNQLPVGEGNGSGEINVQSVPFEPNDLKTLIKDIVKGTSEKLDLTEANIIVSGGRGMQNSGNFKLLEELADTLGATVGATRAVCDEGWVPHSMQVGQTGKTVAPTLYIACGIYGAIQHLAGMSGSKVIVAVNTDPDAPIFKKATYGIVGDALEVVPQLTEEFKNLLSQ